MDVNGNSGHKTVDSPDIDQTTQKNRTLTVVISVALGLLILSLASGVIWFLLQDSARTSNIRDIFVIIMALELLLVGISTVIMIIQSARLINLLQNEIKPVLESANETMNTLRGTATFLSDSLVKPVFKINSYLASIRKILKLININK